MFNAALPFVRLSAAQQGAPLQVSLSPPSDAKSS